MAVERRSNEALFERARRALPGGVSSPVRAFRAVHGSPRFISRAHGCRLVDVEDVEYTDFVLSWGPLILGHAHREVVEAVRATVARGLTFGAPHENEILLAELIASCYPGAERVRFTSSGTEATMAALRLARGITNRERIVKFSGCYHGHGDSLLVAAGSGAATFGVPSSAGVPRQIAELTTVLPLDDPQAFEDLMNRHGDEIAAVIVEPLPANNGLLIQRREFLQRLRELTARHGSQLIFDEVISGFRVALGGAAELYDVTPDLATFGKVVGGGMPVGAFAGPASLMSHLAPEGDVYQAGTLSGNPVAMSAGLTTLRILERDGVIARLEALGESFASRIRNDLSGRRHPVQLVRQGSVFWFSLSGDEPPRRAEDIDPAAAGIYARFHSACLDRRIYLAPSAYEVGFLCTAHTPEILADAASRISAALDEAFAGHTGAGEVVR